MEGHRRKNTWLTIGVSGCCASKDDVAFEKKGHSGKLDKFLSSYKQRDYLAATSTITALVMSPCSFKIVRWRYTGCLAVIDPHRASSTDALHMHLELNCLYFALYLVFYQTVDTYYFYSILTAC